MNSCSISRMSVGIRFFVHLLALFLCGNVASAAGVWKSPESVSPKNAGAMSGPLAAAEISYKNGLAASEAQDPRSVDFYYRAAAWAWPYYAGQPDENEHRAGQLYRSALRQFVISAAKHQRFQSPDGIRLVDGTLVPIRYHGFPWRPSAFNEIFAVGEYRSRTLRRRYAAPGMGVPWVILRHGPGAFMLDSTPFAATTVLRPHFGSGIPQFCLEFYDPLRVCRLSGAGTFGAPLARDLSAPLAYLSVNSDRSWLTNFIQPGSTTEKEGLSMIEPYQRGKVPLIFIHGLLSDPLTWADLANELRAVPDIVEGYQIWAFRYSTSKPFLNSAATLRQQLVAIRQTYDPHHSDPAFSQMVIVGHSLGGLVAKLQATCSGEEIWRSVANRPLGNIVTDPSTRKALRDAFFFMPSPDISRLIFIGTPHQGSTWARRGIGRLVSALVEKPPEKVARIEQLHRDNPGVFSEDLSEGIPTSIDMLEPKSKILAATNRIPYRTGVKTHSIIGTGFWTIGKGLSDGVVTVESARLAGVQSEIMVDSIHELLHRRDDTVREVARILRSHLHMAGAGSYSVSSVPAQRAPALSAVIK